MHSNRGTVPDRAAFAGGIVTDRDDQIDRRSIRVTEPIPGFGFEPIGRVTVALENLDRPRVYLTGRMTACAESPQSRLAEFVDQDFAENAPRRIAGAKDKSIYRHGDTRALRDRNLDEFDHGRIDRIDRDQVHDAAVDEIER